MYSERDPLYNHSVYRDLVGQAIFGDDMYSTTPVERHDSRDEELRARPACRVDICDEHCRFILMKATIFR
jgi:hypothetical protein